MGVLSDYRTRIRYPDFVEARPSRRYCLRGLTGAQTFGMRNTGTSNQSIFAIQLLSNAVNNDPGALDLNLVFGGEIVGGAPVSASKITDFLPGTSMDFVEGNTVTGATEYSRAYVRANGGATEQLIGQGVIPPGATILMDFPAPLNVAEYTLLIDITAAAERGER